MKQTLTESFFWKWYQVSQKPKVFWPIMLLALSIILFHYFFSIGINFSASAPERYFIFEKNFKYSDLKRDDYVRFSYNKDIFFPRGTTFVKKVGGMEGDVVSYIGRDVYVNGRHIGFAKLFSGLEQDGVPLSINKATKIPKDYYFLYNVSSDSFDSRYKYVGLVHKSLINGKSVIAFGKGHEVVGDDKNNTGTFEFLTELTKKVFS